MKKVFAIVLPLCLLVALAVPALAAISVGTDQLVNSPVGKAGCVSVEDGVEYIQTFVASTMYAHERAVYDQFLALPDNRKLMIGTFSGGINYVIILVPSSDSVFVGDSTLTKIQSALSFSISNGSLTCKFYNGSTGASIKFGATDYLIMGSDFAQSMIDDTSPLPNANFLKYYKAENRSFRDDLPKSTYTLTINYQYLDGSKAADSVTTPFAAGAEYSVASPAITGFTPDVPTVSGIMPNEDVSVTVTYAPNAVLHTLTVNYQYEDGTKAAESQVAEYVVTAPYYVQSPVIAGFTPDVEFVSGRMGEADLTVTVVYTKKTDSGGGDGGGDGGGTGGNPGGVIPPWTGYNPFVKPDDLLEPWTGYNPFVNPSTEPEPWTGYNPFVNPSAEPEPWTGYNPFVNPYTDAQPKAWTGYNPFVKPEFEEVPRSEYPDWWPK